MRGLPILLCASAAHAAIAIDNTGVGHQSPANASSDSFSFTVGTGLTNTKLVCGVSYYSAGDSVTTFTYGTGGSPPTLIKVLRKNDGTHAAASETWYLDSPSTGSNTVSIGMVGSPGASNFINTVCFSFSGMKAGAPEGTPSGTILTGTQTSHTDSMTTVANKAWITDFVTDNAGTGSRAVTNASQANLTTSLSASGGSIAGSTFGPVTPAGNQTNIGESYTSTGNASASTISSWAPAPVTTTGFGIVATAWTETLRRLQSVFPPLPSARPSTGLWETPQRH